MSKQVFMKDKRLSSFPDVREAVISIYIKPFTVPKLKVKKQITNDKLIIKTIQDKAQCRLKGGK